MSVSILNKDGEIVMVDSIDFEHLTDAVLVLEIDKKERVRFFTWQEDKEFIESLEWIIAELEKIYINN